jgi:hypothetical protein
MQFKATELFTNINIVSNLGGIVADCPEGGSGWCTAGSGCQGTNCTGTSFEPGACDGGGSGGCDPDSGSLLKSPITVALGVDPAEFELLQDQLLQTLSKMSPSILEQISPALRAKRTKVSALSIRFEGPVSRVAMAKKRSKSRADSKGKKR